MEKRKVEFLEELKNIGTKRKIGKTTDEFIVYFNENATETIQDRLTKIILKELRRKLDEKMILN
ncbi:hypothetical protein FJR77_07320 [Streptococcus shenyangsis]|uniref:Uncharacterized protein n=1 Tax=Streptococcus shenyangsis TaxID=2589786 RepID=A0ABY2YJZ6_9STRE|nr:hypothetical protein [Streptococcus mitis]TPE39208.1 hypothetical protein FJR73_07145 [Streptococcus sp. D2]TPE39274.1 hypothetical protein FJR77_07320 [Streptococcus shenyangsis]MQQ12807.1 hypothetical protein [Streptococcus mitis]MQQ44633.1 hypothetical protein [Streptococcus mitis]